MADTNTEVLDKKAIDEIINEKIKDEKRRLKKLSKPKDHRLVNTIKYLFIFFFKKPKHKSSMKTLVRSIFCTLVIIIVSTVGTNIWVLKRSDVGSAAADQFYQSNLITAGIGIIGLAIAIWAGLHIVQVIERDRFADFAEKYDRFELERKKNYKEQFLTQLNKEGRSEAQYLYKKMTKTIDKKDDITSNIYYRLSNLEFLYVNVYSKDINLIQKYEECHIDSITNEIMELLSVLSDENLCSSSVNAIQEYLHCRIIGFCFNLNYDDSLKPLEAIDLTEKVIKEYEDLYEIKINDNGITIDALDEKLSDIYDEELRQRYTIHIINTCGEALSQGAQRYIDMAFAASDNKADREKFVKKAKDKLNQAQKVYEKLTVKTRNGEYKFKLSLLPEFVFRNYGVVLERTIKANSFDIDHIPDKKRFLYGFLDAKKETVDSIKESYQIALTKAIESVSSYPSAHLIYHVWGSLYYKAALALELQDESEKKEYFVKWMYEKWTEETRIYMEMATQRYPENYHFYKANSIAFLYSALFEKEIIKKKTYINKADSSFDRCRILHNLDSEYISLFNKIKNHILFE